MPLFGTKRMTRDVLEQIAEVAKQRKVYDVAGLSFAVLGDGDYYRALYEDPCADASRLYIGLAMLEGPAALQRLVEEAVTAGLWMNALHAAIFLGDSDGLEAIGELAARYHVHVATLAYTLADRADKASALRPDNSFMQEVAELQRTRRFGDMERLFHDRWAGGHGELAEAMHVAFAAYAAGI